MLLQHLVVEIVLHLAARIPPVADMTSFVLLSTVLVELIVPIESLATKSTFWMTPKSTLINGSWVVVPEFLMPSKLSKCEKLMLVSEDLLVAST